MSQSAEVQTDDSKSKDRFFQRLEEIAKEMSAAHGKEFAMGALVLAARWLAENKSAALTGERPLQ